MIFTIGSFFFFFFKPGLYNSTPGTRPGVCSQWWPRIAWATSTWTVPRPRARPASWAQHMYFYVKYMIYMTYMMDELGSWINGQLISTKELSLTCTGCRGGFLFGQTETIFLNVEVYIHNCTVTIYTSTDMNCIYIYILI